MTHQIKMFVAACSVKLTVELLQLVAVATVGFCSPAPCSGEAVEEISANCDRSVVRRCRDAVSRHFVVSVQLSDIRKEYHRHSCTGQVSSCSSCLQVTIYFVK